MSQMFYIIAKVTIVTMLFSSSVQAVEVDHFSTYTANASLANSRQQLNFSINNRITQILNQLDGGCNEKHLYKKLGRHFKNGFNLGTWLRKEVIFNNQLDMTSYTFKESIYKNLIPLKFIKIIGVPLHLFQPFLAQILRIENVYLGTDKLGHLLGSGFKYFKRHHLKDKPLEQTLMLGWQNEHGFTGSSTTKIISYADMLANFNGMRFYNHVLQKEDDILGENLGPYVTCQNSRWIQVKTIDLGNYIDHGLDESINCSRFSKKKNRVKVQENIRRTLEEQGIPFETTCPLAEEEVLLWLEEKYGALSPYLLNFQGHSSLDDKTPYHPAPKGF